MTYKSLPNGTINGNGFQPVPGPQATSNTVRVPAVRANMVLQLASTTPVINTKNNYSEDFTVQVTAVRPDTGATIPTFNGVVTIAESGTTIYSQNSGTLPKSATIGGGSGTFVAQSLAGPANGAKPPDAQITTVNYPVRGGGTLAIPQWVISGDGKQVDPQHSGGFVYDWVQARARDIFNPSPPNPPNNVNLATVLAAVSNYTVAHLPSDGQTTLQRGPQSPIEIDVYKTSYMRTDSTVPGECGQTTSQKLFTGTLIHEARHAYQAAQAAIAGNDQDADWLVNNAGPVPLTAIFVDSMNDRNVCNPLSSGPPFPQHYRGDTILDPFLPVPQDPNDKGQYADYALEMDAATFAANPH